jgi:hypothetical protein
MKAKSRACLERGKKGHARETRQSETSSGHLEYRPIHSLIFNIAILARSILPGLFFSPQPSIKILVVWCLFSLFNTESSLWPQPHPKTSLGNYFEGKRILMSQFKHVRSCIICPAEPHILLQVSLAAGMPAGDCTALLFPLQRRD